MNRRDRVFHLTLGNAAFYVNNFIQRAGLPPQLDNPPSDAADWLQFFERLFRDADETIPGTRQAIKDKLLRPFRWIRCWLLGLGFRSKRLLRKIPKNA